VLKSDVIKVLGAASFAEFAAIGVPGTVVWCNFDLARESGFDVPSNNQLTPELHQQLITSLSLRAVAPAEINGHKTVTMYADKYGGDGVSPALGAGRAGFLADGNLYLKGIGFTPLFRHNDKDDFVHSHGGVHFEDCLSEAVFGEVNHNLFTLGSTRIVAIIDQGMHVTEPSGKQRHIALAVRSGPQLRPGHLLARRARGSQTALDMFVQMASATNQLVSNGVPDVGATMLRVVDDHAKAAAESFRWRMIHGALSPSNMDLSGAMLDLPTQSTQPRTAPIFKLDYLRSNFGTEHKDRGYYLDEMYRRVLKATDSATRERFNAKWINVSKEMDLAYRKHLQVKLLSAAGLKTEVANQVSPDLAATFTELLLEMSAMKNQGSACVARRVVEDVAVLDVFNLLRWLPRDYFSGNPRYLKHLRPVYKGNHFQIAKKKERVNGLVREFARVYRELMRICAGYRDSIIARAEFENAPIDALYCSRLYDGLNRAIADYKVTGNTEIIREAIDSRVARSLRNVDRLLAQGTSKHLPDGGLETQIRTIDGARYSVRAWNDRFQTRKVHVSGPAGEFELETPCLVGRVREYTFAVPDRDDLLRMI
jgi:hypothetical protein